MLDHNKNIKIYEYTDCREDFREVNYKTALRTRLFPKKTFDQGELQKVEYYATFDGTTYSDPVLKVDVTYTRDSQGFASSRTTTRTWYYTDGTEIDETKVTQKYYNDPVERIQEGKRRRHNLIDILMNATMSLMVETMAVDPTDAEEVADIVDKGRDFMKHYQVDINAFISESHTDLRIKINGDNESTHYWLDYNPGSLGGSTSIREHLVSELTL